MADDLWNYNTYSSDDEPSDSDDDTPSEKPGSKRKTGRKFDLEDRLPSDKRAKLRKKYGDFHGVSLDFDETADDLGAKPRAAAVEEDPDSDLEIIREEEAAAEQKARELRLKEQQKQHAERNRGRGPIAPEDWHNRQLLARVKARYQPGNQVEEEEEEIEDEELEESPLPAPRVQLRHLLPASTPPEDQFNSDKETPPPSSAKGPKKLKVTVKDKNGESLTAQVKAAGAFQKLFTAFRSNALEKGWLPSKDARLKFVFDGDEVGPQTTPQDLDMEDGDVIDVHYY